MRQMQELQACAKRLQRENDQLLSQVEKILELGKDVQEGDSVEPPIVRNKGKEPVISSDGDALEDDELSSMRKEHSRKHKGQITKEALALPCPQ